MSKEIITASGLKYILTKHGKGEQPTKGSYVSVHYVGKLLDGQIFDTSRKGKPFSFHLGLGEVIEGWDEGIALLKVGDEATFTIPANLAYGDEGAGPLIKAGTTLVFEVELMGIK
ncbi:MAG: FKBP-type peptidyl-prolyl cis-trans isomerase [Flavobacteriales bacterium]|nr:FKBP-type peptidyl-prolyl cis-trans isomerase [Flavobacteriales bacterium]NQX97342.1 FKBP-type peptidyl-prolyl cis-trans isomerase [Flavobacteriales bacterium]